MKCMIYALGILLLHQLETLTTGPAGWYAYYRIKKNMYFHVQGIKNYLEFLCTPLPPEATEKKSSMMVIPMEL